MSTCFSCLPSNLKQLSGSAATGLPDLRSIMKNEDKHTNQELAIANKINEAFISVMNDYMPLPDDVFVPICGDEPILVTTKSMALNLRQITIAKACGPDYLSNWVLKDPSP